MVVSSLQTKIFPYIKSIYRGMKHFTEVREVYLEPYQTSIMELTALPRFFFFFFFLFFFDSKNLYILLEILQSPGILYDIKMPRNT